jgi:hypothetical protein
VKLKKARVTVRPLRSTLLPVKVEKPEKAKTFCHSVCEVDIIVNDESIAFCNDISVKYDIAVDLDPNTNTATVDYWVHGNCEADIERKFNVESVRNFVKKAVPHECPDNKGKPCDVCQEAIQRGPDKHGNYPTEISLEKVTV